MSNKTEKMFIESLLNPKKHIARIQEDVKNKFGKDIILEAEGKNLIIESKSNDDITLVQVKDYIKENYQTAFDYKIELK